jgi:hypothetical protein
LPASDRPPPKIRTARRLAVADGNATRHAPP